MSLNSAQSRAGMKWCKKGKKGKEGSEERRRDERDASVEEEVG